MILSMVLPSEPSPDWDLARQVGVEGAVLGLGEAYDRDPENLTYNGLKKILKGLADADLRMTVAEGDSVPLELTKFGLEGRDAELNRLTDLIKILSDLDVHVMCPNFMAGINWVRTTVDLPIRGKALTTRFRLSDLVPRTIESHGIKLTEEKLWDNLRYYMERVLPVAEANGMMVGMHPDDPPISPVHNMPRILTNRRAFDRLFSEFPSPSNGVTFCQANFRLMGDDIYELAEEYAKAGRIHFVHFRDVDGIATDFFETFHDDGPTDMARMMQIYETYCVHVPIRPDHVPTLEGDQNDNPGYTMRGRLYAMGYIKGLIDGLRYAD